LTGVSPSLVCFSPAGVLARPAAARLAVRRLRALGFDATLDEAALVRRQRFAGDDDTRLGAIHRVRQWRLRWLWPPGAATA